MWGIVSIGGLDLSSWVLQIGEGRFITRGPMFLRQNHVLAG